MKTDGKDPVKFERKYKEPGKSRLLDMKKAGIKKIAPDEVAA